MTPHRRMTMLTRQDDHRGAEGHVLGDAGEPAEDAKRLVERGRVALVHI